MTRRPDDKIHRCTNCGGWAYENHDCQWCGTYCPKPLTRATDAIRWEKPNP